MWSEAFAFATDSMSVQVTSMKMVIDVCAACWIGNDVLAVHATELKTIGI